VSRIRSRLLATATAIGISLVIPFVPTAASASPFTTSVAVLATVGTGCPTPSSVTVIYPSIDSFTLLYSQFQAYGGGLRNCQVVARVNVPSGWSYTIARQINRGWAQLDAQGSAVVQTNAYFSDGVYTDRHVTNLTGPYNSDFQQVGVTGVEQWSFCNRSHTLNINDVISVTGPASSNTVALFSKDVSASTTFFIRYRPC